MKKLLSFTLAILCVALLGLSLVLWQKLRDAREGTARIAAARSALEARVATLEQREKTLQSETAALRQQQAAGPTRGGRGPQTAPGGQMTMGRPMQALESPEMRRLMAIEQKGRLDGRYAALFKSLKLPPEQLDKLKQLLVDKQSAPMDVFAEARAQGMMGPESRAQIQELLKSTNQEIEENIHGALGDAAYAQYQHYDQTQVQRNLVDQLSNRLSYSDAPLSSSQTEQLVALLAANASQTSADTGTNATFAFAVGGPGGGPPLMMGGPGGGGAITNEAIAAAQGMLTSTQIEALRQLQAEQQAQQQMVQTMRQNFAPPGGSGTTTIISGPGGANTTTTTTSNIRPPNG